MDGSWTFGAPADLIAAPSSRKRPRDAADISEINPGQQLHDARVAFTVPKPAYRRYPSMPTEQSSAQRERGVADAPTFLLWPADGFPRDHNTAMSHIAPGPEDAH